MTLLAGFLDVLLRGLGSVGLSAAVGGVIFALVVLRPFGAPTPLGRAALRRSLRTVSVGAAVLALTQAALRFVIHPWALADASGWPLGEFLATDFGRAGLVRVALGLALMAAALWLAERHRSRVRWGATLSLAALLMLDAAWLAHAVSRLEGRAPLMAVTVLHQLGAVVWAGGIIHLVGFALLWRRARAADDSEAASPGPLPDLELCRQLGRPHRHRLRHHGSDQGGAPPGGRGARGAEFLAAPPPGRGARNRHARARLHRSRGGDRHHPAARRRLADLAAASDRRRGRSRHTGRGRRPLRAQGATPDLTAGGRSAGGGGANRRHPGHATARGVRVVGIQSSHRGLLRLSDGYPGRAGSDPARPLGAALAAALPRARRVPLLPQ